MQPPKPPPPPGKKIAGLGSGPSPALPPPLPQTRSGIGPWICLGGATVVFGIVAVAVVWQLASRPLTVADVPERSTNQDESGGIAEPFLPKGVTVDHQRLPTSAIETAALANKPSNLASVSSSDPVPGSELPPGSHQIDAAPSQASVSTTSPSGQSPTLPDSAPMKDSDGPAFTDLRRRNFELPLPQRGITREGGEVVLASVPVAKGELLDLAVTGGAGIRLVRASDTAEDASTWTVMKKAQLAFGGQEDVTIGRFEHRDGDLRFEWDPAAPAWAKPGSLQFCRLVVTVGKQSRPCSLSKPIVVNPTRLTPQSATNAELPLPGECIDASLAFRVHFQFAGTRAANSPSAVVGIDETATILLGDTEQNGVEAELKINAGDLRSSLQVRLFAKAPVAGKDGEIRFVRQEVTPAIVQNHRRLVRIKDQNKYKADSERFEKQIMSRQSQIAARETAMQTAPIALRDRYELEIASLNQQIEQIESMQTKVEADLAAMQEFAETVTTWCDTVGGILQNLEDAAQLRYAVYLDTVPRTVVVETSGFEWK